MSDNVHKGHRERLRQKFLKTRFAGFADHEKLELLLHYARPIVDTKGIAHNLLNKFRTLGGVFDASVEQLKEIDGINDSTAVLIKLIPEISKEYINSKSELQVMKNGEAACEYFKNQFIGERNEVIRVACVDDRLRLIACEVIAEGTPGSALVNIRKLIEFTYKHNCESIIIAHNHPNGDLLPSDEDLKVTKNMYKLLKPVGINLIDHIIVAGGQSISLRESGAFTFII